MGLQQLTGITVPIRGRNVDIFAWPTLMLGLTSGGIFVPMLVGSDGTVQTSGGGGGGDVVITGTTANGNTTSAGSNISPAGSVTIPAGAISVEFLFFPSAAGTVNGITFDNTTSDILTAYRLDSPTWRPLAAVTYILTAGTGVLTVQT